MVGVWGRGAQTGNSLKRGVCVYERVACVMERRRMLAGQIRGSECTAASAARILDWVLSRFCLGCLGVVSVLSRCCLGDVSVLSRFCLGVVSVLSRCCFLWKHTVETHCGNTLWTHCGNTLLKHTVDTPHLPQSPYHPTGGVIGIYIEHTKIQNLHSILGATPSCRRPPIAGRR